MSICGKSFSPIYPRPVDDDTDVNPRFSRLRLAASNPDWMPLLSHNQVAQAHKVLPVDTSSAVVENTSLPAASSDPPSTSYMGFLNRFYRTSNSPTSSTQTHVKKAPQPPAALGEAGDDISSLSVKPVLPIDVAISIEPNKKVSAVFPFPIGETSSSLAMSDGTWGALGSVSIPKVTKAIRSRPVAPLSIDCNCSAPKPLWADLPQAMSSLLGRRGYSTATPSLFGRNALRTEETSASERFKLFPKLNLTHGDTTPTCTPAPPCPISTSPTRDAETAAAAATPLMGASSTPQTFLKGPPQPLLPPSPTRLPASVRTEQQVMAGLSSIDEDPSADLMFLTHKENDADSLFPDATPEFHMYHNSSASEAPNDIVNEKPSAAPTSPGVLGFSQSIEEPGITRIAAEKRANVRNFLNTLFSSSMVAAPSSDLDDNGNTTHRLHPEADANTNFDSLEWAIRGSIETPLNFVGSFVSQTLAGNKATDRNSYPDNSLDRLEDRGEEGLEHLRRVVSIVIQTSQQQSSPENDFAQWGRGGGDANGGVGATSSSTGVSNYVFEGNNAPLFFGA
ncbi:unnamed protein product [Phytomonas sp. EM1]|nr:unnamed protein product [Phytomonas sp. EM1]|eukprot:CCW60037.1 unnamed protein product [Phytomonas sp. isolate EM1]